MISKHQSISGSAADKAFNLQFKHKNMNRSINNQQIENAFKQIQSINQFRISVSQFSISINSIINLTQSQFNSNR